VVHFERMVRAYWGTILSIDEGIKTKLPAARIR